jgi:selenocysteine lyase/cysteine desulfurase
MKDVDVKPAFDIAEIRAQFPILKELVHGKPLVYFDNAATSQKPRRVIKAESAYYATINANVHRGVHTLSTKATEAQEAARETIRRHINAKHAHEVIFTSGTTASMNLAAFSLGQLLLKKGDEVLISGMEHHANIVPWQLACERHGAKLKVIPVTDSGELALGSSDHLIDQLSDRTRILAISHVSNTLGTINPIKEADRRGEEARHHHRGGWRTGDRAPEHRRAGPRLRPLRFQRAQGLRSHGHGCALRPRGIAGTRCPPGKAAAR